MSTPPPIRTERLEVRPLARGEGVLIAGYFRQNREFLQPFYPTFGPDDFSDAAWERLIPIIHSDLQSGRAARMCLFLGEELVGVANVTGLTGHPRHTATLGYSLSEAAQGKGLMREALRALVPWAFARFDLHRIEANYMPRNERSGAVLRDLGFEREGLAREYMLVNGAWEDHVLTARLNPDWRGRA